MTGEWTSIEGTGGTREEDNEEVPLVDQCAYDWC